MKILCAHDNITRPCDAQYNNTLTVWLLAEGITRSVPTTGP